MPTGLTEDRYVKSVEVGEVKDVDNQAGLAERQWGDVTYSINDLGDRTGDENNERVPGLSIPWPVHEVGRNADIFDEDAGRLLKAKAGCIRFGSLALKRQRYNRSSRNGFRFHEKDYEPKYQASFIALGNGVDIRSLVMRAIKSFMPTLC
ncbi:MAG: hypothetical protein Ct9H90mP25_4720 [Gammaproteobacteria bacterium]|nr:MAG: hypothetical protein Ct9H90mP25_4720 [Gammaproteobacteria bacterium]